MKHDIVSLYGEFLKNAENICFDKKWLSASKALNSVRMFKNGLGMESMIEIVERLMQKGGPDSAWYITDVSIEYHGADEYFDLRFGCDDGRFAKTRILLVGEKTKPVLAYFDIDAISDGYELNDNINRVSSSYAVLNTYYPSYKLTTDDKLYVDTAKGYLSNTVTLPGNEDKYATGWEIKNLIGKYADDEGGCV